jgi:serine/threonine protein kinase
VKTEGKRVCEVCGTVLSKNSDFCPVCALRGAGGQESAPSEAPNSVFDSERNSAKTEPASTVRRFENYEVMLGRDGEPIELGRGAMGITYKAFDIDLRFPVTLKVISEKYVSDESARLRFLREARAAAKVRHPNVASVLHLGRTGSGYFYAMEFVEGETLERLIKRSGRLDVRLALEITSQVAGGLDAIYDHKLVHRDIKPTNIMVSLKDEGRVTAKIIDLGLAKGASELGFESDISSPGAFAGTPAFASPEQFAGLGADIRSDLYSLGVTLWEMLAGQVPFRGSPSELMHEHQHASVPLEQLKGLPQPVVVLLEVMLEKDPAQRFQSPSQLLKAIPLVTAAINGGRTVTPQELRAISGEGALQKSGEFSAPVRRRQGYVGQAKALLTSSRFRLFAWLVSGLLIGGVVVILMVNLVNHPAAKSPVTPSISVTAPEKSIAVLPFENISANKDDAYFADGVQDEILNNLAKIAQLKVISRTSVMQYRPEAKRDLRQIAAALGVANVLEGTVRRDGNHVRVSTELVDARNDNMIWADSYDRDLTDIFAMQSEIAQMIANKLTATLSPQEKKWIEARPTDNLEAYDLYLQAKELIGYVEANAPVGGYERPSIDAIALLEQAIRLDPKFTLAYCASGKANDWLYNGYDPSLTRRALGDEAIRQAVRLQPELPEVHLANAHHLYFTYRDYERARVQLAIARRGLPNDSEAALLEAFMDRRQGYFEQAIQRFNEAISLDPRNVAAISELGVTFSVIRQFTASEREYDRAIDLAPDHLMLKVLKADQAILRKTADDTVLRSTLAALPASMAEDRGVLTYRLNLAFWERDWQQAWALIEQMNGGEDDGQFAGSTIPVPVGCYSILIARLQGKRPELDSGLEEPREQLNQKVQGSGGNAVLLSNLAIVDALLGKKENAIEEAKRAAGILPVSRDAMNGPIILIHLAAVYAWTDEHDLALETLGPLAKTPNGIYYGGLKLDPLWDPLRKDPRFDKLLAELAPRD